MTNFLYYGDNLQILRDHIRDESVDLIYLDPPFKSNQDYNILFSEQDGSRAAAQIMAFEDTWRWDQASAAAFQETVERGGRVSRVMQAFYTFLGGNDMMAYLSMMAPRLIELQRVLRETGSIYLHCDPTASHYLKLLMDAIFDPRNYLNEIVWHYRKWPAGRYTFQRNHDVILFYSRSQDRRRTFNQLYMERAASTLKRFGTAKIVSGHDEEGRRLPSQTEEEDSEGVRMDDVWNIGRVPPIKQLYPTQKPDALLERILQASSDEEDVVLDPFCGCGTTISAAQKLNRSWIGIDITHLAIGLIKHRLLHEYGKGVEYEIIGEPVSLPDAEDLARSDPHQFQLWAVGTVGGRVERARGADQGIDGRIYFHDDPRPGNTKQIIISVKSGRIPANHLRELRGVIEREGAEIGVLLTLRAPTRAMLTEAARAGVYDSPWGSRHPRLQILTVEDLLSGAEINYPHTQANVTLRRPAKKRVPAASKQRLPFGE